MKQHYLFYCLLVLTLLNLSCKKNGYESTSIMPSLISNAEAYFNAEILSKKNSDTGLLNINSISGKRSPRQQDPKKPLWNYAYIAHFKRGTGVVVPVTYSNPFVINTNFAKDEFYNLNTLTKLFIYQDASKSYHAELITAFPDSNYKHQTGEDFKGLIFVDDWWGNPINKFQYQNNKIVLTFNKNQTPNANKQIDQKNQKTNDFYVCYEIYGINYSAGQDTIQWSEPAGCSYIYGGLNEVSYDFEIPPFNPSGGDYGNIPTSTKDSGLTVPLSPLDVALYNGNSNIKNVKDYIKCFTNVAGADHSYTVRLCVDQPEPGSDKAWGFTLNPNDPVNVGHTFLILTETTFYQTTTRNFGFYPTDYVKPNNETRQGVLNNDEVHDYDVSLLITLTNSQFTNLLTFISQGNDPGYMYNLNSNNCTTFALNALASVGVSPIPRTAGTWVGGGKGLNPGNLGEDIKTMTLAPNMTRTTISGSHLNQGNCN